MDVKAKELMGKVKDSQKAYQNARAEVINLPMQNKMPKPMRNMCGLWNL